MWTRILQAMMNQLPTKAIKVDEQDLFYRSFVCKIFGWIVYLHKYLRSDPDRGLHSHPFDAYALVLSGGYWEERLQSIDEKGMVIRTKWLHPGAINGIDRHCFHRLQLREEKENGAVSYKPSWSLFFCKYVPDKTWGFLRQYPHEDTHMFMFRKHTENSDRWWWKSAPKGKYTCRT